MNAPADRLRLYSSWRGVVFAFVTPSLLLAVGALAAWGSGFGVVSIIILVVGAGFLVVSLFDFPMHTTFDANGIKRRAPLRLHTINWDDVIAINRARGGRVNMRAGPLAAAVGRRRYLLVDRTESADEYAQLCKLLTDAAVPVSAVAPDPKNVPTWLYHEKH